MTNTSCKISAEIGWNHCGDMKLAKQMICAAAKCGADYAKFQIWSESKLKPGPWDQYRDQYKQSELTPDKITYLLNCCAEYKIEFLASIFNVNDIYKVPDCCNVIKIPSPEINNIELLSACRDRFQNIIIAAGASTIDEIKDAYDICRTCDCTILHCVSIYPCPPEKANLSKIHLLQKEFTNAHIGYSDHTIGPMASIYAICHNCTYIEKHFTTNNDLLGKDNKYSSTPDILKTICQARSLISIMKQNNGIEYHTDEQLVRDIYRRRWSS